MKIFLNETSSPLFKGITEDEFEEMTAACIRERGYSKNDFIFRMGNVTTELGIVASGSVVIENLDAWGNTGVLTKAGPGSIFAETYALCGTPMMVQAKAQEDSLILFLNLSFRENRNDKAPAWQPKLIKNLLDISARKNITLSERMFCISHKTVRGRVLTFLSKQAGAAGCAAFSIPFDRQQMADYLNVDRTALSKELGKMRDEGLITFRKNEFTIL